MAEKKILVIIPAYNEQESISHVITVVKRTLPFANILVVNDGSLDQTSFLAQQSGATVLDLPFNLGIGGAMQTGFCYARDFGYDIAVQFDADAQHRPEELPLMFKKMEESESGKHIDIIIASRFLLPGGFKTSLPRRIGIRYFSFLIFLFTGKQVSDPTSGLRMISKKAINLFAENYAEDYPEPEACVLALKKRLNVLEIPTYMHARTKGVSSITPLKAVYYMLKVSLDIFLLAISR